MCKPAAEPIWGLVPVPAAVGFEFEWRRGKEIRSSSSVACSWRLCCARPWRRRFIEGRAGFWGFAVRNQAGCWVSSQSSKASLARGEYCVGPLTEGARSFGCIDACRFVAGSRLGSARRASRASAAFAVALLSRDSSLVPSKAVLRREPRRRRVRCCARAADIARLLVVPPFPALCDIPEWWSSSPSWSMPGCCPSRGSCAARLTRRKESLERREPESIRLWPLLALPDRVRGDSSWTAKSAVLSLSIGASGTRRWNVSSVNLLALIKFGSRFRFSPWCFCFAKRYVTCTGL
jgi:hypothetical protein